MIKEFLLSIFFPKFCFLCQKEGTYLCEDCQATIEISEHFYCLCKEPIRLPQAGKCLKCSTKALNGLYFGTNYQKSLIKELIQNFKYEPFVRELKEVLSGFITTHFDISGVDKNSFSDSLLIPIPLDRKRIRWRGFNQAEEISKELSVALGTPLIKDVLFKIKTTLPQAELSGLAREENIKRAFVVKNPEKIKGKKILLVDDVYTSGATMEEAAQVLKKEAAKEVWGIAVARG